jgi:hypothetical protein
MKPHSTRPKLGLIMQATDLAEIDRLAALEEISRASWARRVLRQRLREIAASPKPEAVA